MIWNNAITCSYKLSRLTPSSVLRMNKSTYKQHHHACLFTKWNRTGRGFILFGTLSFCKSSQVESWELRYDGGRGSSEIRYSPVTIVSARCESAQSRACTCKTDVQIVVCVFPLHFLCIWFVRSVLCTLCCFNCIHDDCDLIVSVAFELWDGFEGGLPCSTLSASRPATASIIVKECYQLNGYLGRDNKNNLKRAIWVICMVILRWSKVMICLCIEFLQFVLSGATNWLFGRLDGGLEIFCFETRKQFAFNHVLGNSGL